MRSFKYLCVGALLALAVPAVPSLAQSDDGKDRHVIVVNQADQSIWKFYASNVDAKGWEEDLLHDDVIISGERMRFNIDDGTQHCYYDFKAVMKDGQELEKRGVNVCTTETWTIYNN